MLFTSMMIRTTSCIFAFIYDDIFKIWMDIHTSRKHLKKSGDFASNINRTSSIALDISFQMNMSKYSS